MKKISIVFPVLLLVCTGILITGCPSDPEPGKTVTEPDMVFVDGKYQFRFDTPRIEHGKTYEVILTIDNCDEDFIGSRLGGKICYKMDLTSNDEKVLSGWSRPVPDTVAANIHTYKWTFKAGDKNSDSVDPETNATTPSGGMQYFAFTAQQNSDWNDYPSGKGYNFNINGKFEIKEKEVVSDWTKVGEITLGNADSIQGKGELSSEAMTAIRDMPAGSKITLTVSVTVSNDPGPGYGIGTVGADWSGGIGINVPNNAATGPLTFTVDIEISAILEIVSSGNIIINIWNCTITKAELFRPTNAAPNTWVSAGTVTLGNADGTAGKGTFNETDMAIINALPANSKIAITTAGVTVGAVGSGSNEPGWGVGSIGGWVSYGDNVDSVPISIPSGTEAGDNRSFTVEIKISDIRAVFPNGAFSINIWNGTVTKAELFKPGT